MESPNYSEFRESLVDNPEYGIDAAMWVGFTGVTGISAVADLLTNVSTLIVITSLPFSTFL